MPQVADLPHIAKAKADGWHYDPVSRVERLLARAEKDLQQAFLRSVAFIRDKQTLDQLEALIRNGRIEEAISTALQAFSAFSHAYVTVIVTSAQSTAALIARELKVVVGFDQTNTGAVSMMQQNSLRLVREFSQQQRLATRQALIEGIRDGLNPRQQAIAFRNSIGLTARQESAVANFRRLLSGDAKDMAQALARELRDARFDRTVQAAIDTERALEPSQINRMVTRYRERYLKYRSETIARTEALRSVHQGADAMYRQAVADGVIDGSAIESTWITAKDERVRDPVIGSSTSHRTMEGQVQSLNQPFVSGAGAFLRYPGDPDAPGEETIQCRCVITRRFKGTPAPGTLAAA